MNDGAAAHGCGLRTQRARGDHCSRLSNRLRSTEPATDSAAGGDDQREGAVRAHKGRHVVNDGAAAHGCARSALATTTATASATASAPEPATDSALEGDERREDAVGASEGRRRAADGAGGGV